MEQGPRRYYIYHTPAGRITLVENGHALTNLYFGAVEGLGEKGPTALMNNAATQIQEYFAGKRTTFDIPFELEGSPFQKLVWEALCTVPYGETRTYAQVAAMIGRPTAQRAVGGANNKNPLPIIVPCHRVIGADGNLVGYAAGLKIKRFLLDLEAQVANASSEEEK